VLALMVLFVTRLVNHAAIVVTQGNKHMETESHVRPLFDRLAVDIAQMVKRTDVSYFLKNASSGPLMGSGGAGVNDRLAFYSSIPGYYDQTGYNSGYSVVAYRVNTDATSASYNRVERMAKGLPLNGAYTNPAPSANSVVTPVLFFDNPNPSLYTTTIDAYWPAATKPFGDPNYYSPDTSQKYEMVSPQVFRFEYYYLTNAATPALVPYPTTGFKDPTLNWTDPNTVDIKDVAAIVVAVAAIDPQSRKLLTDADMNTLVQKFPDYTGAIPNYGKSGALLARWQDILQTDAQIIAMPRPAIQGIRFYERYFYLNQ